MGNDPLELAVLRRLELVDELYVYSDVVAQSRLKLTDEPSGMSFGVGAARDETHGDRVELRLDDLRALDAIERLERVSQHGGRNQPPVAQCQHVLGFGGDVIHQLELPPARARVATQGRHVVGHVADERHAQVVQTRADQCSAW